MLANEERFVNLELLKQRKNGVILMLNRTKSREKERVCVNFVTFREDVMEMELSVVDEPMTFVVSARENTSLLHHTDENPTKAIL